MTIGSTLKKLRKQQGRSIREVVNASDGMLDKTTVSRIERDERGLSLKAAYCFSRVYGIDMEALTEMLIKKKIALSRITFDTSPRERQLLQKHRTLARKYQRIVGEIVSAFALLGDYKSTGECRGQLVKDLKRVRKESY